MIDNTNIICYHFLNAKHAKLQSKYDKYSALNYEHFSPDENVYAHVKQSLS